LVALLIFAFPHCAQSQERASVAPANLQQLVTNAQTILRGHVASITIEPHPEFANLQTIVVTMSVTEVLKGQAATSFKFRQLALNADTSLNGSYHKTEELLLFLNPVSPYGLTSPVGLEQGCFRISMDPKRNRVAVNGRNNIGLFTELQTKSSAGSFSPRAQAMLAKRSGQVSIDALEDAIRSLAGARP
jgi:hypothetical protein